MTHWQHGYSRSKNGKARWEKRLRQLEQMRTTKERKRLDNPIEREPKFERWFPIEFGVRDKITGETAWHDLKSVRHAANALGLILKFYSGDICTVYF